MSTWRGSAERSTKHRCSPEARYSGKTFEHKSQKGIVSRELWAYQIPILQSDLGKSKSTKMVSVSMYSDLCKAVDLDQEDHKYGKELQIASSGTQIRSGNL